MKPCKRLRKALLRIVLIPHGYIDDFAVLPQQILCSQAKPPIEDILADGMPITR